MTPFKDRFVFQIIGDLMHRKYSGTLKLQLELHQAALAFGIYLVWYPYEEADDLLTYGIDLAYLIGDPVLLATAAGTASILAGGLVGRAWWSG